MSGLVKYKAETLWSVENPDHAIHLAYHVGDDDVSFDVYLAADVEAVLDTSMRRQETLAKNVNDGLLEIRSLREENKWLRQAYQQGHPTPCTFGPLCPYCEIERRVSQIADLCAHVTALEQERDEAVQKLCPTCGGEGHIDSGGVSQWDAPIEIDCPSCGKDGLRQQLAAMTNRVKELEQKQ